MANPPTDFDKLDKLASEHARNYKKHLLLLSQNCTNCFHFNKTADADTCTLFKLKPPARVIVTGCEKHDWEIPF